MIRGFDGRVAAVTGAASGIGRALALELARRGAEVAVSDVDADGLAGTVQAASRVGAVVSSSPVDVADRDAVLGWAEEVAATHGRVNMVVNNAGVALGATAEGVDHADLEWLMGVDFWGVVHGTTAFLPHLRAAGEGHVVNVSSVFGLVGIPSQSAYNAAKFAVRGYTEALRVELDIQRCGVSATTVHPGGIRTNIARSARSSASLASLGIDPDAPGQEIEKAFLTSPERAARVILAGVARNRRRVLVGPDAYVFALVGKLPPGAYQPLLARAARRRAR